jgi:hypothetical protein
MIELATLNLTLQIRAADKTDHSTWNKYRYRFARPNGWHCGHWHASPEMAAECVELKDAD